MEEPLQEAEHAQAGAGEAAGAEQIQQQQEADSSAWGSVTMQGMDVLQQSQTQPAQLNLLQTQQQEQLLQQDQQQNHQHQPAQLTPEQLAALTGALGGQNLAALTGALNGTGFENNELLQRLMVVPAGASAEQPAGLEIQLPRAPDLVSTSLAMNGASTGTADAAGAVASSAAPAVVTTLGLTLQLGAAVASSQPQQLEAEQPTPDAVAAAVAAAAAAAAAGSVEAGQLAVVDAELQLQLQRGVKRKAGELTASSEQCGHHAAVTACPIKLTKTFIRGGQSLCKPCGVAFCCRTQIFFCLTTLQFMISGS
jgi:hypothetical protein